MFNLHTQKKQTIRSLMTYLSMAATNFNNLRADRINEVNNFGIIFIIVSNKGLEQLRANFRCDISVGAFTFPKTARLHMR